ncbi:hypothetical protein CEXT_714491 [Caerostris extrusa]|uniref:Uncharacterized protein n=1 Tax=Caerostris extrusa TaxID=172846 RepID=A0AAV4PLJ4_CAEEX|nr:hypothetical protein CEXT_714491 [Caerostris extrusa]
MTRFPETHVWSSSVQSQEKKSPLEIVTTKQDQSSRVKAVGLERGIVPNSSASSDPGRPFKRTVRRCSDGLEGVLMKQKLS